METHLKCGINLISGFCGIGMCQCVLIIRVKIGAYVMYIVGVSICLTCECSDLNWHYVTKLPVEICIVFVLYCRGGHCCPMH